MPARINNSLLNVVIAGLVISLSLLSLFNFHKFFFSPQKVLGAKIEQFDSKEVQLSKELAFWQKFLAKNPNYVDGWIEVSRISLLLGDKGYSKVALDKAISIDPNSPKIIEIQKEVASK